MTNLRDRLRKREDNIVDDYEEEEVPYYYPNERYIEEPRYPPPPSPVQETEDNSPLAIVKEVKKRPSPKGTLPTTIGGVPVDLHILEDYLVKTSPYAIKTIMRYHSARTIEEMRGTAGVSGIKMNSKTIILIMLCIGMVVLGILMLTVMPDILAMFGAGGT